MKIVVQKFGGAAVANTQRINDIVKHVEYAKNRNFFPVIVVSAMAGTTNYLIQLCQQANSLSSNKSDVNAVNLLDTTQNAVDVYNREKDVALHTGEVITASLTAITLAKHAISAKSILGWQIPIRTSSDFGKAIIENIETSHILECLNQKIIPIIPGFQGIDQDNNITTLGRGGSDITATAIAAAIKAEKVEFYKDVPGVYDIDPRLSKKAKLIKQISHENMLELSKAGSKVLHPRAVEIAMRYNIPLEILSVFREYTLNGASNEGTIVN